MDQFKPIIAKVSTGAALEREEARLAFDALLSGEVTAAQAAGFLMALRVRGETVDEIIGAVSAMRGRMLKVDDCEEAVDIVGTGGDASGSYNVSTIAAIIMAGAGAKVAKHGNRAASSKSGAADVLTALGVKIGLDPEMVTRCVQEAGVGFMFAPTHHASMRNVASVRVELGTRTIFNLLGPLSNPAGVKRQMIGVFAQSWIDPMAQVLRTLGAKHVWIVHGSDGLDEITTTGSTSVAELLDGQIRHFSIDPAELGLAKADPTALKGGDADYNAKALRAVLAGETGAYADIACLNAAAGLVVAGLAKNLDEGLSTAKSTIASGKAMAALETLIRVSNG